MSGTWRAVVLAGSAALGTAIATSALSAGQKPAAWTGMLDEHPAIQYATRPTTDRVAQLSQALADGRRSLPRDDRNGYLRAVLDALGVPIESQLLVFSKTGVQRAFTSPHNPRAIFFDRSVVVAHVPGAPLLEVAAHDPQQGVVFYTVDQTAASPAFTRRTSCLTCHVSGSTLDVPGIIVRSHTVADDGQAMPQAGSNDVNHGTGHPDRWGGWLVTSDDPLPYSQRAHAGNITSTQRGDTSNQVFVDWLASTPETRGYLTAGSDIVALLAFDHQMHAINLLTRLNWEARVVSASGNAGGSDQAVQRLAAELADYLLFVDEAPLPAPLTPNPRFAKNLALKTPKDRRGRSLAQLNTDTRLLQYPCSYMVYAEAFDALPPLAKRAVYRRLHDILSGNDTHAKYARLTAADRRAVFEILTETKPDFSAQ
jgi:hypothetical protein